MQDLKKVVPPDRVILEDITLAFLPGAKIGVLGANGAGKSSLLKIMALIDTDFQGEAKPAPGVRVGFLPQEPALDESKDGFGLSDSWKILRDHSGTLTVRSRPGEGTCFVALLPIRRS